MRVSLLQPHRQVRRDGSAPRPLLRSMGAAVVLGGAREGAMAESIRPAADTLFGPRGATMASPAGPLFVSETGHLRLLGWRRAPGIDFAPAELVFGQPDFTSEGRNGGGGVGTPTPH